MSKRLLVMAGGFLMAALSAPGASPVVGFVASRGPVKLNGITTPATAITLWPVTSGTKVTTMTAPAAVLFNNSAPKTIAPNSQLTIGVPPVTGTTPAILTVLSTPAKVSLSPIVGTPGKLR